MVAVRIDQLIPVLNVATQDFDGALASLLVCLASVFLASKVEVV